MLKVLPAAPSTLRSTEPPLLTLCAVAKPAIPPFATASAPASFQPFEPGKQFSSTTALPVEHARATGVACTESESPDTPPVERERTAYVYVVPFDAALSAKLVVPTADARSAPPR